MIIKWNWGWPESFYFLAIPFLFLKIPTILSPTILEYLYKIQISNNVHFTYDKSLSFEATKCEHFTFIVYNRH